MTLKELYDLMNGKLPCGANEMVAGEWSTSLTDETVEKYGDAIVKHISVGFDVYDYPCIVAYLKNEAVVTL